MDKLLHWWPLLAALVIGSVAWGVQQAEITNLKEDSLKYEQAMVQQSAIDERTKNIKEDVKDVKDLLMQIIQRIPTK